MDVLVSPSASPCNGDIADRRLKWGRPFGKLRISRNLRKNQIRVVQIKAVGYQIEKINYGKASFTTKNFGALMLSYSEIGGACVDTVFGYVSIISRV